MIAPGPVPPGLLLQLSELEEYGIDWQLLDPFVPRPIVITIATGGALGTMTFTWNRLDRPDQVSGEYQTLAGATFQQRISEGYVDLTFAAGIYVSGSTYTIDTSGMNPPPDPPMPALVTSSAGAFNGLTARRFDPRISSLMAANDYAVGWMQPKVVPPILTWGNDVRRAVAALFSKLLLSVRGMAPTEAGSADANVIVQAQWAEDWLKSVGRVRRCRRA